MSDESSWSAHHRFFRFQALDPSPRWQGGRGDVLRTDGSVLRHELVSAPSVFPILRTGGRVLLCNSATYVSFVASSSGVAALRNLLSAQRL